MTHSHDDDRMATRRLRSRAWFDDPANAHTTALYLERYMNFGLSLAELQSGKPIIGIAQTGSDLSPCNRHHLVLAERVREGVREAGGIVLEFPVHPIQETGKRPTAALARNLAYLSLVEVLHGYPIDGVVLTKLDGDARGGAALSVRAVTGRPLKFVGMGEKLDALEAFHPDRMASRILGMGDVMSLIEKAQETVDRDEAEKLAKKLKKNSFDLDDFRSQLKQVKKLGGLGSIMGMIPGMGKMKLPDAEVSEKELTKVDAIISSMTPKERTDYTVINGSRRARIARGSGTQVQDVNRLLKQFAEMRKMMKAMSSGKMGKMSKMLGGRMPF